MKVVLEDLTKEFPARGKKASGNVVAVDHVSFEIPDGSLTGLLGPSGCGKSTTLFMLCGLLKPTGGKIFFGEDDVTDLPAENRGVGIVFQNYALYPHLTVRQNILFPLENLKGKDKLSKTEMNKKAEEAAALVQIESLMDRKPSELSGGQQQRVAIARAMVKMPRVLLLDEPLSNLDARLRLQTREEIRRIQRETGITTVFVTHDQEEAMSISDQIVVMKEGVVQQIGRPQDVYDDPVNLFVAKFLGTPPINVFEGRVQGGILYIGEDAVLDLNDTHVSVSAASFDTSTGDTSVRQATVVFEGDHRFPDSNAPAKSASNIPDGDVTVGIRPEGFVLAEDGPLHLALSRVEVLGRDISVVSTSPHSQNESVRSIISAEARVDTSKPTVAFKLKPAKVFLFHKETEERIRF